MPFRLSGLFFWVLTAWLGILGVPRAAAQTGLPFLDHRMLKVNPPLRGNTYLSEEDAANAGWFFDLDYWKRTFAMMAAAHYSSVSFWHSHPFGNMVTLTRYPEAALFDAAEMERQKRFWHALFRLAHQAGIDIYWITWNIHVTGPFAKKHSIPEQGKDSPLVRDYLRECVLELLREYPEIDGLGTCAGEAMGGMNAAERETFIRECYLEPIRETGRVMPFLHRSWGADPKALSEMLAEADYPGEVLVDLKFNGEHLYSSVRPHVQDRRWVEGAGRGYRILWHLRNDDLYQFNWGDPEFARAVIENCRSTSSSAARPDAAVAGFVMGSEVEIPGPDRFHTGATAWHKVWHDSFEKHWLRWMLWGSEGRDPETNEDVGRVRYQEMYGRAVGRLVYRAMKTASKIVPQVTSFHWNYMNGDWYPEGNVGGWNTSAEMPRRNFRNGMWHGLESYLFNNTIDDSLAGIPETVAIVARSAPAGRSSRPRFGPGRRGPLEVAESLDRWAGEVEQRALEIEREVGAGSRDEWRDLLVARGIERLDCDLMDLRCVARLGRFYAAQIRASLAYALVLFGEEGVVWSEDPVRAAERAAGAWDELAELADTHYVPHEVWLMGTFSWGRYAADAHREIEQAARVAPIPRSERAWDVGGRPVRTVRWHHIGDPIRDAWIDLMNDQAGVVRGGDAGEARTTIAPVAERDVQVTIHGSGFVEGVLPGGVKVTPGAPSAAVSKPGRLALALDPSTAAAGSAFWLETRPVAWPEDQIVITAAGGKPVSPFALVEDEGSLHGRAIDVPKGVGHGKKGFSGPIIDNGWADYEFDAALPADYELWARVTFRDPDSNSFFIVVDGGTPVVLADDVWHRWHWVKLGQRVSLAAGRHSLRVRNREDGVRLDEIRMLPVGLDARALLPRSFAERCEILGKEQADSMMAAYFRKMTPVRQPEQTASRGDWEARRNMVRALVRRDIGLDVMPEALPLDARIVSTLQRDGYTLNRLYFQILPGCYGSGWLYLPEGGGGPGGARPAPAILNPHGHWQDGALNPVPQSRMIALAGKGYVSLMTDSIHAADFETGMTPIGLMTLQNIRALDYLCRRDDVDSTRLGITGASGGGQQTMYMMALEDRLKVAVPVVMACYFERILMFDWWHCWCNHAPGIATDTDMIEMLCAFAPRPALFLSSTKDWTAHFAREEFQDVRRVWSLYGAGDQVRAIESEAPHGYERPRREAMYRFMNEHLGVADPTGGAEPEIKPESLETLRAMERPIDGLRDWARAAAWYRRHHRPGEATGEIPARLAALVRAVTPRPEQVGHESRGELAYEGGMAERLLIHGEAGLRLPALWLRPKSVRGPLPAVVLVAPQGKSAAFEGEGHLAPLAAGLLERGVAVLALDVRITGELGRNWERNALAWGRPDAGMAADDVRWAAADLARRREVDPRRIGVVGLGRLGMGALIAAVLDERISACVFDSLGKSYTSVPLHDTEGYYSGRAWLGSLGLAAIPHILEVADLPRLAAACRARTAVIDPGTVSYGGLPAVAADDGQAIAAQVAGFLKER